MKITTKFFDEDLETRVIDRSSQRNKSKPRIRRKCVIVAQVQSDTKQEYREGVEGSVGFYTELTLFRTKKNYILQISGVSTCGNIFPRRNKILEFDAPEDLFDMICDKTNKDIYWSPLIESLMDETVQSEYLTDFEKNRWELAMVEGEE